MDTAIHERDKYPNWREELKPLTSGQTQEAIQTDIMKSKELQEALLKYPKHKDQIIELAKLYCDPRLHGCELIGDTLFYTDPATGAKKQLNRLGEAAIDRGGGSQRVVFEGPTPDTVVKLNLRGGGTQSDEELGMYIELGQEDRENVVKIHGFRKMSVSGRETVVLLEEKVDPISIGDRKPDTFEIRNDIQNAELYPDSFGDEYINKKYGLHSVSELGKVQTLVAWGKARLHDANLVNMGHTQDRKLVFHDFGSTRKSSESSFLFSEYGVNFEGIRAQSQ